MTKIQQVRREFGDSFQNVVRGFAEDGISQRLTAASLGMTRTTLVYHCRRFDLLHLFKPRSQQAAICRAVGQPKNYRVGPPRKYTLEYVWECIGFSQNSAVLKERFGICRKTVVTYTGMSWSQAKAFSQERESL